MDWIILAEQTISELMRNRSARSWLARSLPNDVPRAFRFHVPQGEGSSGEMVDVSDSCSLAALWPSHSQRDLDMTGSPLMLIWSPPKDKTIWSLGEEDRPLVIERLCQLATRIWSNQSIPEHWEQKKLHGFPTIFVAGRQLTDIRVCYKATTEANHRLLIVGPIFLARSQEESIHIPAPDKVSLGMLHVGIAQPLPNEIQDVGDMGESSEEISDDSDVVIGLPGGESHHLFALRYPDWVRGDGPLTKQQRRVIAHKVKRPLRIHGPAGSGKTLVLMLKSLALLREAESDGSRCHLLVVAHSNEMRNTIRTAIEAIDDKSFMATTRDDPQYLEVETLHGWCIRQLGLEQGPKYVLEMDPTTSRYQQMQILDKVLTDAFEVRHSGLRNLLSNDFRARLDGDRSQLLRDLAWEIAIRIKGRGFRKGDLKQYAESQLRSFVGRNEILADRHFIFHVYQLYEEQFESLNLLDTDDVILSMANRLTSPLWQRQRKEFGYDFVLVDETHLFNENERRVLPDLTRGTTEYLPLIMTFDEAQSIGGRRSLDLRSSGISDSERQNLTYVHRSSPEIFRLATYLVESSSLVFSEFVEGHPAAMMSKADLRRCRPPDVIYGAGDGGVLERAIEHCNDLKKHNYRRLAVIVFDQNLETYFKNNLAQGIDSFHYVRERGELAAAVPRPGVYLMAPEACGGLEFDAVTLVGVDEGRVPPRMGGLSPQGYLSVKEESYMELYTATTRAKYVLTFACDSRRGVSSVLRQAISAGLLSEGTR